MMQTLPQVKSWMRTNWFLVLLAPVLLTEWLLSPSLVDADPQIAEAVILFDLCLFVPLLYVICYRRKLAPAALTLRIIGLICLGIFIASKLVPEAAQTLLPQLSWARSAGLVVLALVELRLLVEILRMIFSGKASAQQLAERSGTPEWLARLMLLEARFWKAVWTFIRGR